MHMHWALPCWINVSTVDCESWDWGFAGLGMGQTGHEAARLGYSICLQVPELRVSLVWLDCSTPCKIWGWGQS